MKSLYAICLIAFLGTGCSKDEKPLPSPPILFSYWIVRYDDPERMMDVNPDANLPSYTFRDAYWQIRSSHNFPVNYKDGYITENSDPVKFDSLVQAHGDTHWNQLGRFPPYSGCMFRVTTGLHAVCDKDFDAAHPAGTSMDDLLTVHYYSLDTNLVNGEYVSVPLTEEQKAKNYEIIEYDLLLSEFNTKRLKLLASDFIFWLTKAPTKTDAYSFTFTYTNEDGKKLVTECRPLTIQGEKP